MSGWGKVEDMTSVCPHQHLTHLSALRVILPLWAAYSIHTLLKPSNNWKNGLRSELMSTFSCGAHREKNVSVKSIGVSLVIVTQSPHEHPNTRWRCTLWGALLFLPPVFGGNPHLILSFCWNRQQAPMSDPSFQFQGIIHIGSAMDQMGIYYVELKSMEFHGTSSRIRLGQSDCLSFKSQRECGVTMFWGPSRNATSVVRSSTCLIFLRSNCSEF